MVLTLLSTGGNPGVHANSSARTTHPRLQEILTAANRKFASSQFESALLDYRRGLAATPLSIPYYRAVFLTGAGNCEGMLLKNSEAIRSFNQALRLARKHRWPDIEMKAAVGRITIYKRMWDLPAARQTVRESQWLFQETREPATLAQLASIALDVDFDAALRLYGRAILEGSMRNDNQSLAMLWAQLGYAWLMHGDAAEAEPALTEAFRLRKSAGGREMQGFYYMLGWLRRLQGRCGEARTLLQEARSRAPEPGSVAPYFIERELARTAASCGDLRASVAYYENTLRLIEEWRAFMLPAEAFRANAEEGLHSFFAEFVGVGLRLYEQTGDPRLSARLFMASQASRRSLFRAESARQAALPPAYLAKVAEYRRVLGQSINDTSEELTARLNQLRLELANLEAEAGIPLEKNSPQFF